jgi:chemotaxis protein MotB
MRTKLRYCTLFVLTATILFACVPQRKLEEEKARRENCEKELAALKTSGADCETRNNEMKAKITEIEKQIAGLQRDTSIIGSNYRNLTVKYDKLNQINDQLQDKLSKMLEGNLADTKKLSGELQLTQEQLLKKQDELRNLEKELNAQKARLEQLEQELKKREARVKELEDILAKKDQAVNDLKKKVSDALTGFEGKGLTVTQKNGKVYVSMDESLLFATGSTKVESKGVEALKKLAKVLEGNPDINILVEGHTDDVPMKGAGEIKDNWDLSVMRATSVVKIITSNSSVDPKRLTAAGKGEFMPLDPGKTTEARKKNRRTEIILTPKLDELFKVLESN